MFASDTDVDIVESIQSEAAVAFQHANGIYAEFSVMAKVTETMVMVDLRALNPIEAGLLLHFQYRGKHHNLIVVSVRDIVKLTLGKINL